jgi:hypothetical protein
MSRKLIGAFTILIALVVLGAAWWGVVEAANSAQVEETPPAPAQPVRQGFGEPEAPDISFIDSPTAQCYQPEQHKDACYIQWQYLYVSASTSQYIISMTVAIDGDLRAYHGGFFQTDMYVPQEMLSPGFKVPCGVLGSGGNPKLGMSYAYTIRARETGGLKAANYGSVTCPADIVPPGSIRLEGPDGGLPGVDYSFTALVEPVTTTLPLTYTWTVSDQSGITVTSGLSDTQNLTWNTTGLKQVSVQAANLAGSVTVTRTIEISNVTPTPSPTPTPPPPLGGYLEYLPMIISGGGTPQASPTLLNRLQQEPVLLPVLRFLKLTP